MFVCLGSHDDVTAWSASLCRLHEISTVYVLPDWVCDVKWVWFESMASLVLVLITAHNVLIVWKPPPTGIVNTVQCKENCILYPAPLPSTWEEQSLLKT